MDAKRVDELLRANNTFFRENEELYQKNKQLRDMVKVLEITMWLLFLYTFGSLIYLSVVNRLSVPILMFFLWWYGVSIRFDVLKVDIQKLSFGYRVLGFLLKNLAFIPVIAAPVWAYHNFDGIVLALVYQNPVKLMQDNWFFTVLLNIAAFPVAIVAHPLVIIFSKCRTILLGFIELFIYPPI